jgi:hypothetical protein
MSWIVQSKRLDLCVTPFQTMTGLAFIEELTTSFASAFKFIPETALLLSRIRSLKSWGVSVPNWIWNEDFAMLSETFRILCKFWRYLILN